MVRVLGRDDTGRASLAYNADVAKDRVERGQITVLITEYFDASTCLLLLELGLESNFNHMCADVRKHAVASNVAHAPEDYVDAYLNDAKMKAGLLSSHAMDC